MVFHKWLGWGMIRGVISQSPPRYAVEFDEEFCEAYDCDGLCDEERGSYVFEERLLTSDSLLSYLCCDIKEEINGLKTVWKDLTLWGKFLLTVVFIISIPNMVYVTLKDKYKFIIGKGIYKVINIFRIYKE